MYKPGHTTFDLPVAFLDPIDDDPYYTMAKTFLGDESEQLSRRIDAIKVWCNKNRKSMAVGLLSPYTFKIGLDCASVMSIRNVEAEETTIKPLITYQHAWKYSDGMEVLCLGGVSQLLIVATGFFWVTLVEVSDLMAKGNSIESISSFFSSRLIKPTLLRCVVLVLSQIRCCLCRLASSL